MKMTDVESGEKRPHRVGGRPHRPTTGVGAGANWPVFGCFRGGPSVDHGLNFARRFGRAPGRRGGGGNAGAGPGYGALQPGWGPA